jgi:hypothetical protein
LDRILIRINLGWKWKWKFKWKRKRKLIKLRKKWLKYLDARSKKNRNKKIRYLIGGKWK